MRSEPAWRQSWDGSHNVGWPRNIGIEGDFTRYLLFHLRMDIENHKIEWKETWRDEYLKWICGFANAQGGMIVIGKNDSGKITGVTDSQKLLEDIPNKVRDILGIMVDVILKRDGDQQYLEIIVDSYPYPVSYKGQYFYRSGSTVPD